MENNESKFSKDSCLYTASLSPYICPVMTAVTSKMRRMVLIYMLALSMVSLPTSLARHLLVKTAANQRGDDYTDFKPKPAPGPPPISPDYSLGIWTERDKGELFN